MRRWTYPDYAVVVGPYHLLYKGISPLVRTRQLRTLGRAIMTELESLVIAERSDAIYLRAAPLRAGDRAALVPAWVPTYLSKMGRRADMAGLRLPGTEWVAVDRDGRVVPAGPILDIPSAALDELPAEGPPDKVFVDEPVDVDAVFAFTDMEDDPFPEVTRGFALHRLLGATANLERVGDWAPDALRRLVERADARGIGFPPPRDLLDGLAERLGEGRAA